MGTSAMALPPGEGGEPIGVFEITVAPLEVDVQYRGLLPVFLKTPAYAILWDDSLDPHTCTVRCQPSPGYQNCRTLLFPVCGDPAAFLSHMRDKHYLKVTVYSLDGGDDEPRGYFPIMLAELAHKLQTGWHDLDRRMRVPQPGGPQMHIWAQSDQRVYIRPCSVLTCGGEGPHTPMPVLGAASVRMVVALQNPHYDPQQADSLDQPPPSSLTGTPHMAHHHHQQQYQQHQQQYRLENEPSPYHIPDEPCPPPMPMPATDTRLDRERALVAAPPRQQQQQQQQPPPPPQTQTQTRQLASTSVSLPVREHAMAYAAAGGNVAKASALRKLLHSGSLLRGVLQKGTLSMGGTPPQPLPMPSPSPGPSQEGPPLPPAAAAAAMQQQPQPQPQPLAPVAATAQEQTAAAAAAAEQQDHNRHEEGGGPMPLIPPPPIAAPVSAMPPPPVGPSSGDVGVGMGVGVAPIARDVPGVLARVTEVSVQLRRLEFTERGWQVLDKLQPRLFYMAYSFPAPAPAMPAAHAPTHDTDTRPLLPPQEVRCQYPIPPATHTASSSQASSPHDLSLNFASSKHPVDLLSECMTAHHQHQHQHQQEGGAFPKLADEGFTFRLAVVRQETTTPRHTPKATAKKPAVSKGRVPTPPAQKKGGGGAVGAGGAAGVGARGALLRQPSQGQKDGSTGGGGGGEAIELAKEWGLPAGSEALAQGQLNGMRVLFSPGWTCSTTVALRDPFISPPPLFVRRTSPSLHQHHHNDIDIIARLHLTVQLLEEGAESRHRGGEDAQQQQPHYSAAHEEGAADEGEGEAEEPVVKGVHLFACVERVQLVGHPAIPHTQRRRKLYFSFRMGTDQKYETPVAAIEPSTQSAAPHLVSKSTAPFWTVTTPPEPSPEDQPLPPTHPQITVQAWESTDGREPVLLGNVAVDVPALKGRSVQQLRETSAGAGAAAGAEREGDGDGRKVPSSSVGVYLCREWCELEGSGELEGMAGAVELSLHAVSEDDLKGSFDPASLQPPPKHRTKSGRSSRKALLSARQQLLCRCVQLCDVTPGMDRTTGHVRLSHLSENLKRKGIAHNEVVALVEDIIEQTAADSTKTLTESLEADRILDADAIDIVKLGAYLDDLERQADEAIANLAAAPSPPTPPRTDTDADGKLARIEGLWQKLQGGRGVLRPGALVGFLRRVGVGCSPQSVEGLWRVVDGQEGGWVDLTELERMVYYAIGRHRHAQVKAKHILLKVFTALWELRVPPLHVASIVNMFAERRAAGDPRGDRVSKDAFILAINQLFTDADKQSASSPHRDDDRQDDEVQQPAATLPASATVQLPTRSELQRLARYLALPPAAAAPPHDTVTVGASPSLSIPSSLLVDGYQRYWTSRQPISSAKATAGEEKAPPAGERGGEALGAEREATASAAAAAAGGSASGPLLQLGVLLRLKAAVLCGRVDVDTAASSLNSAYQALWATRQSKGAIEAQIATIEGRLVGVWSTLGIRCGLFAAVEGLEAIGDPSTGRITTEMIDKALARVSIHGGSLARDAANRLVEAIWPVRQSVLTALSAIPAASADASSVTDVLHKAHISLPQADLSLALSAFSPLAGQRRIITPGDLPSMPIDIPSLSAAVRAKAGEAGAGGALVCGALPDGGRGALLKRFLSMPSEVVFAALVRCGGEAGEPGGGGKDGRSVFTLGVGEERIKGLLRNFLQLDPPAVKSIVPFLCLPSSATKDTSHLVHYPRFRHWWNATRRALKRRSTAPLPPSLTPSLTNTLETGWHYMRLACCGTESKMLDALSERNLPLASPATDDTTRQQVLESLERAFGLEAAAMESVWLDVTALAQWTAAHPSFTLQPNMGRTDTHPHPPASAAPPMTYQDLIAWFGEAQALSLYHLGDVMGAWLAKMPSAMPSSCVSSGSYGDSDGGGEGADGSSSCHVSLDELHEAFAAKGFNMPLDEFGDSLKVLDREGRGRIFLSELDRCFASYQTSVYTTLQATTRALSRLHLSPEDLFRTEDGGDSNATPTSIPSSLFVHALHLLLAPHCEASLRDVDRLCRCLTTASRSLHGRRTPRGAAAAADEQHGETIDMAIFKDVLDRAGKMHDSSGEEGPAAAVMTDLSDLDLAAVLNVKTKREERHGEGEGEGAAGVWLAVREAVIRRGMLMEDILRLNNTDHQSDTPISRTRFSALIARLLPDRPPDESAIKAAYESLSASPTWMAATAKLLASREFRLALAECVTVRLYRCLRGAGYLPEDYIHSLQSMVARRVTGGSAEEHPFLACLVASARDVLPGMFSKADCQVLFERFASHDSMMHDFRALEPLEGFHLDELHQALSEQCQSYKQELRVIAAEHGHRLREREGGCSLDGPAGERWRKKLAEAINTYADPFPGRDLSLALVRREVDDILNLDVLRLVHRHMLTTAEGASKAASPQPPPSRHPQVDSSSVRGAGEEESRPMIAAAGDQEQPPRDASSAMDGLLSSSAILLILERVLHSIRRSGTSLEQVFRRLDTDNRGYLRSLDLQSIVRSHPADEPSDNVPDVHITHTDFQTLMQLRFPHLATQLPRLFPAPTSAASQDDGLPAITGQRVPLSVFWRHFEDLGVPRNLLGVWQKLMRNQLGSDDIHDVGREECEALLISHYHLLDIEPPPLMRQHMDIPPSLTPTLDRPPSSPPPSQELLLSSARTKLHTRTSAIAAELRAHQHSGWVRRESVTAALFYHGRENGSYLDNSVGIALMKLCDWVASAYMPKAQERAAREGEQAGGGEGEGEGGSEVMSVPVLLGLIGEYEQHTLVLTLSSLHLSGAVVPSQLRLQCEIFSSSEGCITGVLDHNHHQQQEATAREVPIGLKIRHQFATSVHLDLPALLGECEWLLLVYLVSYGDHDNGRSTARQQQHGGSVVATARLHKVEALSFIGSLDSLQAQVGAHLPKAIPFTDTHSSPSSLALTVSYQRQRHSGPVPPVFQTVFTGSSVAATCPLRQLETVVLSGEAIEADQAEQGEVAPAPPLPPAVGLLDICVSLHDLVIEESVFTATLSTDRPFPPASYYLDTAVRIKSDADDEREGEGEGEREAAVATERRSSSAPQPLVFARGHDKAGEGEGSGGSPPVAWRPFCGTLARLRVGHSEKFSQWSVSNCDCATAEIEMELQLYLLIGRAALTESKQVAKGATSIPPPPPPTSATAATSKCLSWWSLSIPLEGSDGRIAGRLFATVTVTSATTHEEVAPSTASQMMPSGWAATCWEGKDLRLRSRSAAKEAVSGEAADLYSALIGRLWHDLHTPPLEGRPKGARAMVGLDAPTTATVLGSLLKKHGVLHLLTPLPPPFKSILTADTETPTSADQTPSKRHHLQCSRPFIDLLILRTIAPKLLQLKEPLTRELADSVRNSTSATTSLPPSGCLPWSAFQQAVLLAQQSMQQQQPGSGSVAGLTAWEWAFVRRWKAWKGEVYRGGQGEEWVDYANLLRDVDTLAPPPPPPSRQEVATEGVDDSEELATERLARPVAAVEAPHSATSGPGLELHICVLNATHLPLIDGRPPNAMVSYSIQLATDHPTQTQTQHDDTPHGQPPRGVVIEDVSAEMGGTAVVHRTPTPTWHSHHTICLAPDEASGSDRVIEEVSDLRWLQLRLLVWHLDKAVSNQSTLIGVAEVPLETLTFGLPIDGYYAVRHAATRDQPTAVPLDTTIKESCGQLRVQVSLTSPPSTTPSAPVGQPGPFAALRRSDATQARPLEEPTAAAGEEGTSAMDEARALSLRAREELSALEEHLRNTPLEELTAQHMKNMAALETIQKWRDGTPRGFSIADEPHPDAPQPQPQLVPPFHPPQTDADSVLQLSPSSPSRADLSPFKDADEEPPLRPLEQPSIDHFSSSPSPPSVDHPQDVSQSAQSIRQSLISSFLSGASSPLLSPPQRPPTSRDLHPPPPVKEEAEATRGVHPDTAAASPDAGHPGHTCDQNADTFRPTTVEDLLPPHPVPTQPTHTAAKRDEGLKEDSGTDDERQRVTSEQPAAVASGQAAKEISRAGDHEGATKAVPQPSSSIVAPPPLPPPPPPQPPLPASEPNGPHLGPTPPTIAEPAPPTDHVAPPSQPAAEGSLIPSCADHVIASSQQPAEPSASAASRGPEPPTNGHDRDAGAGGGKSDEIQRVLFDYLRQHPPPPTEQRPPPPTLLDHGQLQQGILNMLQGLVTTLQQPPAPSSLPVTLPQHQQQESPLLFDDMDDSDESQPPRESEAPFASPHPLPPPRAAAVAGEREGERPKTRVPPRPAPPTQSAPAHSKRAARYAMDPQTMRLARILRGEPPATPSQPPEAQPPTVASARPDYPSRPPAPVSRGVHRHDRMSPRRGAWSTRRLRGRGGTPADPLCDTGDVSDSSDDLL
ncbi:unnamed protein product [Vitrella brassicaformis CCMP3155]|uniref:EF-hand domain-containing protein n=2 Tax=Eukaryota TaxID=2759 RepID=A0A0G4FZZ4_VITBC|nr:unnamed protein product [Vitrella brassicaformis CCMP3155]|eukprot:CEM21120.1 unnamed protein product [Vitrella brassicaformis CCMP3155]